MSIGFAQPAKACLHILKKRPLITASTATALLCCAFAVIAYGLSIAWRVGVAEERLLGRNHTINLVKPVRTYKNPPTAESFGSPTYLFARDGKLIHVYKPLINGFQHSYGSALAAYELGDAPADVLFRLVEYWEAYTKQEGRSYAHYIDTKKDLANNAVGRRIGCTFRGSRLTRDELELALGNAIIDAIDNDEIIKHHRDPRVRNLPEPQEYGCPWLPQPQPPSATANAL